MFEFEKRAFVSEAKYEELLRRFALKGLKLESKRQITYYLSLPADTRVQISSDGSGKVWQKLGTIHDDAREEIELKITRDEAADVLRIFKNAGVEVKVAWCRERTKFIDGEVSVFLDNTVGYGYVVEVEMKGEIDVKEECLARLNEYLSDLDIAVTPREVFDKAYADYLASWKEKIGGFGEAWLSR